MQYEIILQKLAIAVSALAIAVSAFIYGQNTKQQALGGMIPGMPAKLATSSNVTLTTTVSSIIATSSCASRVITTPVAIQLTFADKVASTSGTILPTLSFGEMQATNTTVVYDSSLYGCGLIRAISWTTGLGTVSDFR